jgi:uncharacterized protein (DUF486 family)
MDIAPSRWLPVVLLICSNIFMTFAWYGHLKFKDKPLLAVILASWGIAFFEYCFQVPANRWGSSVYSAAQLKIIQEVVTLTVFCVFAFFYLGEKIRWNYIAAFAYLSASSRRRGSRSGRKTDRGRKHFPDQHKRAREIMRLFIHPIRHHLRREPIARLDFLGMQDERPFAFAAINPAEFPARFLARVNFEKFFQRQIYFQPKLFAQLAHRARVVILARVHVAGRRRIPFAFGRVFEHGTFLEKHLATRIEHQHMHRAMPQPARMNLLARRLPDHLVALVDDVKNFFAHAADL